MGKARRFNRYDAEVKASRERAELYGRQRQQASGLTSTFRAGPTFASGFTPTIPTNHLLGDTLILETTATVPDILVKGGNSADNTLVANFSFSSIDSASNDQEYCFIKGRIDDNTSGTEDGELELGCTVAGTEDTNFIILNSAASNEIHMLKNVAMNSNSFAGDIDVDGYDIFLDIDRDSAIVNDRDSAIGGNETGIKLNSNIEYIFTATKLQLKSQNSAANTLTKTVEFWGKNASAVEHEYAFIKGRIDTNTAGAEEGELELGVTDGGIEDTNYIILNTAASSEIHFLQNVAMNGNAFVDNVLFNANVTLGNAATDLITMTGKMASDIDMDGNDFQNVDQLKFKVVSQEIDSHPDFIEYNVPAADSHEFEINNFSVFQIRDNPSGKSFIRLVTAFTDANRPTPAQGGRGAIIYNTDDTEFNYSDGTNWRLMSSGATT